MSAPSPTKIKESPYLAVLAIGSFMGVGVEIIRTYKKGSIHTRFQKAYKLRDQLCTNNSFKLNQVNYAIRWIE